MQEWERSRESVPVERERTKVYPEGRKEGGQPITEILKDKYLKPQTARVSHFKAATRLSLELTMLEAGYLGVRTLSCDKAIDTDERDRWDRAMKSRDTTIDELTRKVAQLEAKLRPGSGVFGTSDSPLPPILQPKTPDPLARQSQTRAEQPGAKTGIEQQTRAEQGAQPRGSADESRTAPQPPVVNQTKAAPLVASPSQAAPCNDGLVSPPPVSRTVNRANQKYPRPRFGTRRRHKECLFSEPRPVAPLGF